MRDLLSIAPGVQFNADQNIFVIASGNGYTTLGRETAARQATAIRTWMGDGREVSPEDPPAAIWESYQDAMTKGAAWSEEIKTNCTAELCPELIDLEGCRVEVTAPDGERRRFLVGKSTGWMPCHLELANVRSHGGGPAYIPKGSTIRVIYDNGESQANARLMAADGKVAAEAVNGMDALSLQQWATDFATILLPINRNRLFEVMRNV